MEPKGPLEWTSNSMFAALSIAPTPHEFSARPGFLEEIENPVQPFDEIGCSADRPFREIGPKKRPASSLATV
jgi:hypothetical protein